MNHITFEEIWKKLILSEIASYQNRLAHITVKADAKEAIYNRYTQLNQECKQRYMEKPNEKLDRHKVCACLMYAILQADVLDCDLADADIDGRYLVLNEHLALTVGLSLLRAFIITAIQKSEDYSNEQKAKFIMAVDNGIKYPECNHGSYEKNFVAELHYTKHFFNYNVLSLANTLFLLEIHTLAVDAISKQKSAIEDDE